MVTVPSPPKLKSNGVRSIPCSRRCWLRGLVKSPSWSLPKIFAPASFMQSKSPMSHLVPWGNRNGDTVGVSGRSRERSTRQGGVLELADPVAHQSGLFDLQVTRMLVHLLLQLAAPGLALRRAQ